MFLPDFSAITVDVILIAVLGFIFLLQAIYFLVVYGKVAFHKSGPSQNNSQPPVSIIICARNEGDNLTEFLPEVMAQSYPEFEVIVVNDCSYDNTEDVMREFSKIFPNLKAITVKEDGYYTHGKKFALMVGIKGAKYEHLVFTDADCKPASKNWLSLMASAFTDKQKIILGYGAYFPEKGFLNKVIRFDTFLIGLQYLSAALRKRPYMGVGRNMAYKKELFFKSKSFSSHYHIKSGDDDLFINQVADAENTGVVVATDAHTISHPKKTLAEWWRQKQRHLTTAPHYKTGTKISLGYSFALNYLFWGLFITCLCFKTTMAIAGGLMFLRWMIMLLIYANAAKRLNEKGIVGLWFVFDLLFLFIYPALHLTKRFFRPNKWMN
ncbi:MAG: glycosyltransferase [Bacteroidia bacterium]|nr:glycosyltransferase [Bacteroidia bacterium]